MSETTWPPRMLEPVDVHRVAEQTMAALDAWVTKAGHVEVEVVVGEEPEEGVEFEVTTNLREHVGGPLARCWESLPTHRQARIAECFIATDPGEIIELPAALGK